MNRPKSDVSGAREDGSLRGRLDRATEDVDAEFGLAVGESSGGSKRTAMASFSRPWTYSPTSRARERRSSAWMYPMARVPDRTPTTEPRYAPG